MSRRLALVSFAAALAAVLAAGPGGAATGPDSCLRGAWKMGPAESTSLLQRIGIPNMTVTRGVVTAVFDGRNMQYGSERYQLKADFGGLTMTGTSSFLNVFAYTTRAGKVVLGRGTTTQEDGEMSATSRGRTVTMPGTGRTSTKRIPAGGSVSYRCAGSTLRLQLPLSGGIWATFRRSA